MPLPESIQRQWLDADYRVRLPGGGFASIHVSMILPESLRAFLPDESEPWGFVTAWNPMSMRLLRKINRQRQRELRDVLRESGGVIRAGVGVGAGGWREPSLFVTGIGFDVLDALSRRFGQAAIVRGTGTGVADLHSLI